MQPPSSKAASIIAYELKRETVFNSPLCELDSSLIGSWVSRAAEVFIIFLNMPESQKRGESIGWAKFDPDCS
jgi:hypothetical protein